MYNSANPRPSSEYFPESSPAYLDGVSQCDTIVHNFHKILLAGNNNLNEAETYFTQQQAHLQDQINALDELQAAILEEKRCLESQLCECKTQVTQARDQKRTILAESDRLMQHLTQELAHLSEDEAQLQTQHSAVDERIAEMKSLSAQLDKQFDALNKEASEWRAKEAALSREEQSLEAEHSALQQEAYSLEERLAKAERQDEAIALWTRNLDAREGDTAKVRQLLVQRLREVEAEERSVGIDSRALLKMMTAGSVITMRALLDDHDMSIHRDSHCEDIDMGDGDEADAWAGFF